MSPYHQQQQQPTPLQQKTPQHHSPNAPQFTNPSSPYAQHGPHSPYSQQQHTQATTTPAAFPAKTQNQQKPTSSAPEWQNKMNPANFNVTPNQQQQGNFQMTQQQQQIQNPVNANNPQMAHHMETNYQNQGNYQKKAEQTSGTPATTSLYGTNAKNLPEMINVGYSGLDVTPKLIPPNVPKTNTGGEVVNTPSIVNKPVDNNKYLDLSKQHHAQAPVVNTQDQQQYHQQMFDLSNYGKQPKPAAYDDMKNNTKMYDFLNRSKAFPTSTAPASCAAPAPNMYSNLNPVKSMDTTPAPYNNNQVDNKIDLTTKSAPTLNNLLNAPVAAGVGGNNFPNNMSLHQNIHQNKPHEAPKPAAELNIPNMRFGANQQPNMNPAFNPSVMNFASFMQNFQADDRMLGMTGQTPASYYDKNISPAHMFSKNLPQNSSAAFQQMFNTTMASYGVNREQQQNMNYQNRLATTPQAAPQAVVPPPQVPETKAKRPRKKKNATPTIQTPEIPLINPAHQQGQQNQQMAHQQQAHQQQHQHALSVHQQQLAHQGFQSYSGLGKAPSAPSAVGGEASAISLKGSAFNYGPAPIPGLYGENPNYLDEFRGTPNHFYSSALSHRSTPDPIIDKSANPPQAHPPPPSSPYHHLLPPHHPSRSSYPYIDPAAMQQYRMIHSYQAGYHPLGMQHQPPHWHM